MDPSHCRKAKDPDVYPMIYEEHLNYLASYESFFYAVHYYRQHFDDNARF